MNVLDLMITEDFEDILFCHDEVSGLRGIIALHNTTLGPAMGGLRIQAYNSEKEAIEDAMRLSKAMTLKAAAAGLNLGGGSAVVICRSENCKSEALLRSLGRHVESLCGRIYIAEDVGSTVEDMETISQETSFVAGLRKTHGGGGDPAIKGAFGVFRGIQACLKAAYGDGNLRNRKVAVQGIGAVGSELVRLLVEEGARVVVAEKDSRRIDKLKTFLEFEVVSLDKIHTVECDVFSPCALGGAITEKVISELKTRIIAGSANNQLADDRIGDVLHSKGIIYAPDFVINAGGLINVAEELTGYDETSANIKIGRLYNNIESIVRISREKNISTHTAAHEMAIERIQTIREVRRTYLPSEH